MATFAMAKKIVALAALFVATASAADSPDSQAGGTSSAAAALPTVDLGYQIHRAFSFNQSGGFYNFSNIRFAAPPTGNLRFSKPAPPAEDRSTVQDGSKGRICAQAYNEWYVAEQQFLPNYFAGKPVNYTQAYVDKLNDSVTAESVNKGVDPRTTEDCLFLDVVVPKSVFDGASKGKKAPVLLWTFGGGYVFGDKTSYDPAGLIYRGKADGDSGVIFVSFNYRLGAFGFLAGPTFQQSGTANAAFWDQRFAYEWVQKYISKFGGDPNRVTVVGESAGAGSIMHHLTAYAGTLAPPFQQAILQSPAFQQEYSNKQLDDQFNRFLSLSNASNIDELRTLPYEQLTTANAIMVGKATWGTFNFGPAVDGSFVPALPGKLLLDGDYYKNVSILVGHNGNEGITFADPLYDTNQEFRNYIGNFFPTITDTVLDHIANDIYPPAPQHKGSLNYSSGVERLGLAIGDASFSCNANYLSRAYNSYSYVFDVPPATHGEDLVYTFYNNGGVDKAAELLNTTTAVILQDWIVSFIETGVPSAADIKGVPKFKLYGPNSQVEDLALSQVTYETDPAANDRCRFWQKALYD